MDGGWRDTTVLVTGGTGLLGGHLVRRLLGRGALPVVLVRDTLPGAGGLGPAADAVVQVRGDVRDLSLVERVIAEHRVRVVLHLAAQTQVGVAREHPQGTFDVNVGGTLAVLEACRRQRRVEAVVVASSDKVYGDTGGVAADEDAPLVGAAPYDASKVAADVLARSYAATYGLPVGVTRCANFFGPGDLNFDRLVPGTIRSGLRREAPVLRTDGRSVRDWIYVEDAADAYLRLVEGLRESAELHGQAWNISNEQPLRVLEMVQLVLAVMGADLEPETGEGAAGEIAFQAIDCGRFRSALDWAPAVDLATAMERTVDWYRRAAVQAALSGSRGGWA